MGIQKVSCVCFLIMAAYLAYTIVEASSRCSPSGHWCNPSNHTCCSGRCEKHSAGFTCLGDRDNEESFDLSPKDLESLCQVVNRGEYKKPQTCVYMKWTPCTQGQGDANRPCGWYTQTPCEDDGRRFKRNVQYNPLAHSDSTSPLISFPNEV